MVYCQFFCILIIPSQEKTDVKHFKKHITYICTKWTNQPCSRRSQTFQNKMHSISGSYPHPANSQTGTLCQAMVEG